MKRIVFAITCIAALCSACDQNDFETDIHTTIDAPPLLAPEQNTTMVLDRLTNAVLLFDWDKAKTGDYTQAYYKLQIDRESGDFSQPVYTGQTDSGAIVTKLQLTHQQLNKIAATAGVAAGAKGKLKWRIYASNGVVNTTSAETRVMEIGRPLGTVASPNELYLSGSATEAGADLAKAIRMKKLTDGVFEVFTALTAGDFHFVNANTGTPESFIAENGVVLDGAAVASPASAPKPYRITLNFNTGQAAVVEIKSVGLWFAFSNDVTVPLTYDKNGIWQSLNTTVAYTGKDERYKFRVMEADAQGVETVKFYGYSAKDSGGRPTASTPAAYYNLLPADNSQWDFTYKFRQESIRANIYVKFGTGGAYTHEITY
ncbi:SusE domain-containing protein [Chitinophaga horti]|uniref:SusE domain-containing protein n=1 Tax=Chitinophaga horti TaxID=2920382 RepID=A0ABY6IXZ3_9BACT|nr:SusE domain-containing protein [Chitinophaga horti]UYQ91016.1 SusE domain-containing protein [Chitinophaga horti]